MSKIKLYLIGAGILLFFGLVVTVNVQLKKIKQLKADNERIDNNNYQLMADSRQVTDLLLKEKEVTGRLKRDRDSIAKELSIKPKQIEKIVYQVLTQHDTIKKEVPVSVISKNHWLISDTGKCYVWKGEAFLSDSVLAVKKTDFSYNNLQTDVFYRHRSKKFLFIHFGKWIYEQHITPECGDVKVKTFEFIK